MRLIIEAMLADGDNDMVEYNEGVLAVVERPDGCLAELGLTLAEGRSLLAKVIVSRSNATKLLDAIEEPFDQISRGIQMFSKGRCSRRLARLGMTA